MFDETDGVMKWLMKFIIFAKCLPLAILRCSIIQYEYMP